MYIFEFDYCAILILSIMILSVIFRKMTSGAANRVFLVFLILSLLTTAADIFSVAVPSDSGMMFVHEIYYGLRALSVPCYYLYLIALSDGWHHFSSVRRKVLFWIPALVSNVLIFVVNPQNYCIIKIVNGVRTDGPLRFVLYLMSAIYIIQTLAYVIRYRQFFSRNKLYSILAVVPITLVCVAVQALCPKLLIEMFSQTSCLLFYLITVQKPEERLYENTGMFQRYSFQEDMRLISFNKKTTSLCIFKIRNFATRIEPNNYESAQKLVEVVSSKIKTAMHKEGLYAPIYYLSSGCFCVAMKSANREKALEFAKSIEVALSDDRVRKETVNARVEFYECIIHMPTDISEYTELQTLIDNIYDFLPGTDRIYEMKDIRKNTKYRLLTEIDNVVERAMKFKEFEVYYQPVYSASQKRVNAAEALVRLRDGDLGKIDPRMIIESAGRIGAINKLGVFIFEEVCRFVSSEAFNRLGLDYVGVNLSVEQLKDRRLGEKIMRLASNYRIEPSKINFEISEIALETNINEVVGQLKTIEECGFGKVIDQFGVVDSDLRRISNLRVDCIKIDGEVIKRMAVERGSIVVEANIKILKKFGFVVAATGVETREQGEKLLEFGCDYLQGYYLSEALPQDKFIEFAIREGHNVI